MPSWAVKEQQLHTLSKCLSSPSGWFILHELSGDITARPEAGVSNDIIVELPYKRHIFLLLFSCIFPNETESI